MHKKSFISLSTYSIENNVIQSQLYQNFTGTFFLTTLTLCQILKVHDQRDINYERRPLDIGIAMLWAFKKDYPAKLNLATKTYIIKQTIGCNPYKIKTMLLERESPQYQITESYNSRSAPFNLKWFICKFGGRGITFKQMPPIMVNSKRWPKSQGQIS